MAKNLTEHRYVVDSGDSASLAGQAYILQLAYDKPMQENELIATALIVEVFNYSYVTVQSWPQVLLAPMLSTATKQQ